MKYEYRTKPFDHQRDEFEQHWHDEVRGIFFEQGCGKSKVICDTLSLLWLTGKINGVFILAPNGVHRNWVVQEIPKHVPQKVLDRAWMHTYQTSKAKNKGHKQELEATLNCNGLAILAMSYDALMTTAGRDATWSLLKDRKVLYVVDESARIKNPKAKRTIRVIASGKHAEYRRILSGTPVANSPFDVYSQLKFLDPTIWAQHQIGSFPGFKTTFGVWETWKLKTGGHFENLVGYKNLDLLKEIVDKVSVRVTKDEVLDLPPKLYTTATFLLEDQQRKMYEELESEFMTFLDSGEIVTAALAIVRLLRLQQVCCGYLPADGVDEPLNDLCKKNPRLALLKEIAEDLEHPAIIWARFRRDIDLICEALGESAVRYDGQTDDDQRAEAITKFQAGEAKFFVANAQAAGEGLTLTAARTVIYYSNSFNLSQRLQSEDRAHRIGQEHPVNYIDIVASGTVDQRIASCLVSKLDVANMITGDRVKQWLQGTEEPEVAPTSEPEAPGTFIS